MTMHGVIVTRVADEPRNDRWWFRCLGTDHEWSVTVPYEERALGERLLGDHLDRRAEP